MPRHSSGPTFTVAELRAVYAGVWGVQLDGANFRRRVVAENGRVVPTGRRVQPGSTGGKPAVLRLAEVARPTPKADEVLVKIHATTVNRSDVHIREPNRRGGRYSAASLPA